MSVGDPASPASLGVGFYFLVGRASGKDRNNCAGAGAGLTRLIGLGPLNKQQ
jgi:hypothetical protein